MKQLRQVDVLIIGAGPAGSVCGYLLHKAGISCLLVDRVTFPRDKLCGGGMTPKCWKPNRDPSCVMTNSLAVDWSSP